MPINSEGWSMHEYQALHDLKVKANIFNLNEAIKILEHQRMLLARKAILSTYVDEDYEQ